MAHLDGLRGVAILSVLGIHYVSCFQSIVAYRSAWADFPLFRWGRLGVLLFFASSGFVIAMTLKRCAGRADAGAAGAGRQPVADLVGAHRLARPGRCAAGRPGAAAGLA